MPSFWSAVANMAWNRRRSKRMPSESETSSARLMVSFVIMAMGSDMAAMVSAVFMASARRSASGTTRATRPGALGLLGAHHAAGQAHLHGLGLADEPGQALGAAHARHDAELDLGLAELGVVGRDDEVAHHGELAAAAEREARHRGDHRLAPARHLLPAGEEIGQIGVRVGELRHLLDVGAGREGLLRSGDDDAADIGVRLEGVEGLVHLAQRAPN